MDDLVAFLNARLDEDEQTARAATPGPWHVTEYGPDGYDFDAGIGTAPGELNVVGHGYEGGGVERLADARHIARHDPARVLRDIDARRELMSQVFSYEAKIDGEWGCCHDAEEIAAGSCPEIHPAEIPALRLLASVYSDHPSYREDWRP